MGRSVEIHVGNVSYYTDTSKTSVNLAYADMEELPLELLNLPNLKELHIHNNRLTDLPEWIRELRLTALNMSHNLLTRLPEHLAPTLQRLDANHNQISELPNYLPESLLSLQLQANRISRVPVTWGRHIPSVTMMQPNPLGRFSTFDLQQRYKYFITAMTVLLPLRLRLHIPVKPCRLVVEFVADDIEKEPESEEDHDGDWAYGDSTEPISLRRRWLPDFFG